MKLYLKKKNSNVSALAEYYIETKDFIVLKGSIVSETISHSEKFRGAKSIEKSRQGVVRGNEVIKDVHFKSASAAANFVTGSSTNGLTAWNDADGKSLKQLLVKMETENE